MCWNHWNAGNITGGLVETSKCHGFDIVVLIFTPEPLRRIGNSNISSVCPGTNIMKTYTMFRAQSSSGIVPITH